MVPLAGDRGGGAIYVYARCVNGAVSCEAAVCYLIEEQSGPLNHAR
jgi:hypothetical protein